MSALKLYGYPNHRVFKSQIAALYNGVAVDFCGAGEGKSPLGKLPVLQTPAGHY